MVQLSATEASAPAPPVFTVPAMFRIAELETAVERMVGAPVLVVVPVAFVMVTVVLVEAVTAKLVPLLPVAPPVYPAKVTDAPAQPFEPAPVSEADSVYTQLFPPALLGGVVVLRARDVAVPVTVGVVFAHVQLTADVWLNVVAFVPFANVSAPAALPMAFHSTVPLGMSLAPIARNVGVAAPPLVGPAKNVFAVSVANVIAKVPDVVIGLPVTDRMEGTVSATEVTVPVPAGMSVVTSARKVG